MNKEWKKVRLFHKELQQPISDKPTFLSCDRIKVRALWMTEEINELIDAQDIVDQADAIIDLIYYALGTLVEIGIKPDKIFEIVHQANMLKKTSSGKILKNDNGKVLKPEKWLSPREKISKEIYSK